MITFIWYWLTVFKTRKIIRAKIKELGQPTIWNRHEYEKFAKWATKEQVELLVLWALFFIAENLAYVVILQRVLLDK